MQRRRRKNFPSAAPETQGHRQQPGDERATMGSAAMAPHPATGPPRGHSHNPEVLGGCGAEQEAAEEENLLREISPPWTEAPAPAPAKRPWSDPSIRASPARRLPAPGGARSAGGHPWCSMYQPFPVLPVRPFLVLPLPAIPGAFSAAIPGAPLRCVQFALLLAEPPWGPMGTAVTCPTRVMGTGSPHQALGGGSCPPRPLIPVSPWQAGAWRSALGAAP